MNEFRFSDEQRAALCACWKRPREREIAALYLQEVERLIKHWLGETDPDKTTAIKQQIELANKLKINVEKTPELLEQLPQDFEELLSTVWLYHKYGEAYFQQHSEACRKDAANNTASRIMAFAALQVLAPARAKEVTPIKTEFSKLPPNYFQQTKTDADFLRAVASAANEIAWMLRGSKAWLEKPDEEHLIYLLAYSHERHFDKLPSHGNESQYGYPSPFRSFLAELSKIINESASFSRREYKFGAVITRKVLMAIKESRCIN